MLCSAWLLTSITFAMYKNTHTHTRFQRRLCSTFSHLVTLFKSRSVTVFSLHLQYYIEKKEEKNPSVGQFFVFLFVLWTGTVFSYTKKCRIVHHIECIQKTCKWIKGFRFLDSFLNESHFAAIKKRFTQRLQSENNINWCTRPIATGFSQWIPHFSYEMHIHHLIVWNEPSRRLASSAFDYDVISYSWCHLEFMRWMFLSTEKKPDNSENRSHWLSSL